MTPEKWVPIREVIEKARGRRDENAVAIATQAGILVGSFLDRNYPRGVAYAVDSGITRVRVVVDLEIDLVTGQLAGIAGMQGGPFTERAAIDQNACPAFTPTASAD